MKYSVFKAAAPRSNEANLFVSSVGPNGEMRSIVVSLYSGCISSSEQEVLAEKVMNFLNDYETKKLDLMSKGELK